MRGRGGRWCEVAASLLLPVPAGALPLSHAAAGNPVAWFGADSYPAEALRRNEHGRVMAVLGVDAAGRITSCVVTGSSGSAALDVATCRIASDARRVRPATDAHGRPVVSTMPLAVRWELPVEQPAPVTPKAADSPARPHREHRSWFSRLVEAHHLLPLLAFAWAAASRRVRQALGRGRFDADGAELWADRFPPRRRRPRVERVMRAVFLAAPVLALAALLAWLDL